MSKEMFISSSPHETKLAVLEDDQLVEVYYERDTDVGLVGGIYKGRVSRVLPGMQSAFVDIGLDRDAFLYVSDFFFEDQEDYDKILEEAEACAVGFAAEQPQAGVGATTPPAEAANKEATPQMVAPVPAIPQIPSGAAPAQALLESQPIEAITPETTVTPAAEATPAASISPGPTGEAHEQGHFEPRGRRWRHRGRRFGEHRQGEHKFIPRQESSAPPAFEILPGESLAKYSHAVPESPGPALEEGIPAEPEAVEAEALEQGEGGSAAEIGPPESESLEPSAEASSSATDQPEIELPPQSTVEDELYPTPMVGGTPEPAFVDESREDTLAELVQETAQPSETIPEPAPPPIDIDQDRRVPQEPAPVQAGTPATPGAPSEGTYTLREPHQRPRLAPRRGRRGRRGMGYQ